MITKTELIELLSQHTVTTSKDIEMCAEFIRCFSTNLEYPIAKKLHELILKEKEITIRTDAE